MKAKNRVHVEKSNQNKKGESKPIGREMRDPGGNTNNLDLSLPTVKTMHEFKERMDKLQR